MDRLVEFFQALVLIDVVGADVVVGDLAVAASTTNSGSTAPEHARVAEFLQQAAAVVDDRVTQVHEFFQLANAPLGRGPTLRH